MLGYFYMSEIVTTYLLADPEQSLPMDRDEFYEEQIQLTQDDKKLTKSVAVVQVFLFTPDGELILQKRSRTKSHNPRLFDKTLGGHIRYGDSPTFTVMAETLQELAVPSFVVDSKNDFEKTYILLKKYIVQSAIVYPVDTASVQTSKHIDGNVVPIFNTYSLYLGVYGGSVRPADKEAAGMLFLSLANLEEELDETPEQFTEDIKYFLTRYDNEISEFVKFIQTH
jgi:isopentenyldiphosphate isomerase